jgi:hypothetical protein
MEALINEYGKEKDFESGLYDFGFRKYSEETGRFLKMNSNLAKFYLNLTSDFIGKQND